jgi:Tfp pilus assembly PilM family ATPase
VVVLLDVGAQSSNLVFSAPHLVWFRNLAVAGESFTNALLRPLKLTREQAEQLKREPARARRVYALIDLWNPILTYLADEVERSLATCKRQFPGLEVQQMFGLGGGFQLHGVLRCLTGP